MVTADRGVRHGALDVVVRSGHQLFAPANTERTGIRSVARLRAGISWGLFAPAVVGESAADKAARDENLLFGLPRGGSALLVFSE